uniref:F-box domain-containing protein n=1 Tax=Ascaris lumbricoides TaxID=6252 RepID=A0A0M3HZX5_ASCLU
MHIRESCSTSFRPFCKCAMRSVRRLLSRGTDAVKGRIFGRYRKQRITSLPLELQLKILSFLPPQDVLIAKGVCRSWHHIITRHPTSIQRFPVELIIRKRNDGEREVCVHIMQQSELMKCDRQPFPPKFPIAFDKLHSYDDFLRHCIVRSIVLDGNPCQTRGKAIRTRIGLLDADTIHGVIVLLQLLRKSRRLAELHSFSLISWSVAEVGEHGMVDEMLQLVLSAPLKALKVDALYGLHGKLSPETLASLLGSNIQNLMVDFQYFWKHGARKSTNNRMLDELLSLGAGRRLFLKNIPYADSKVIELAEEPCSEKGHCGFFTMRLFQNLMVDFQYFWKHGARKSTNNRMLDELLSVGAGRRLFLKNIPYADSKVIELAEYFVTINEIDEMVDWQSVPIG